MMDTRRPETNPTLRRFLGALAVILGWLSATPIPAHAQCNTTTKGFNTVYCSNQSNSTSGSFAFVDATQFSTGNGDICLPIANALRASTGNPLNGIVVDARGFTSANLTCSINPWGPSPLPPPPLPSSSVVLLPSGTITLNQPLVLPKETRLIGAGSNSTTLKAATGFTAGDMIDMGSSTICDAQNCHAVVVEHLALDASGHNLTGIMNQYTQELSYVNDVAMTGFGATGTGLWLNVHADNSGPYTNIRYSGSGPCVRVYDSTGADTLRQTRVIEGLTCIMTSTTPAVLLDAPNVSLKDVKIQGTSTATQDGILIGSQDAAQNSVLFNIRGSGLQNVIHISNAFASSANNCPAWASGKVYHVCDLTILGLTNSSGTNTVRDDLTPSPTILTNANVGAYMIGEPIAGGSGSIGYSRFTTSASVPTWLVGTGPPSLTCKTGTLYSRTAGATGTKTLYGCAGGSWVPIK